jgi:hypothetical protein
MSDYEKRVFALPPLAEQHRIVAKVDELMALCDRLEASLTTADQTRTRLLEATLAESDALCEEFRLALYDIADGDAQSWPECSARRVAAVALGRDSADILRTEADRPPQGRRG